MAKILVVDDNHEIRNILEKHLTAEGHEVVTAADGLEALQILDTSTPDLMTLDISMPGIDGYEVCRRVRQELQRESLPILIISGNINPEDKIKALDLGADKYITKPFEMDELLSTVKTLITRNT